MEVMEMSRSVEIRVFGQNEDSPLSVDAIVSAPQNTQVVWDLAEFNDRQIFREINGPGIKININFDGNSPFEWDLKTFPIFKESFLPPFSIINHFKLPRVIASAIATDHGSYPYEINISDMETKRTLYSMDARLTVFVDQKVKQDDSYMRMSFFKDLYMGAYAGGGINTQEQEVLQKLCSNIKISQEELNYLFENIDEIGFYKPESHHDRITHLRNMLIICTINDDVTDRQTELCSILCDIYGYKEEIIEKIMLKIKEKSISRTRLNDFSKEIIMENPIYFENNEDDLVV